MKVAAFGAALLIVAIPAFGQTETVFSTAVAGTCQAALFSPGVPSAIVILPTPILPAAPAFGSAQSHRTHSSVVQPGIVVGPSLGGGVLVPGIGSRPGLGSVASSGIGTMSSLGVGTMTSSGVGMMTSSGVGMMTSSGIGSIGMPAPPSVPAPGMAPSAVRGSPIAQPHSLQPSVLVCP